MLIGVDIIDIDRIRMIAARTPRFLHRVYTAGELEYCFSKSDPHPSLAVRFAAKEAVRKLHPVFIRGIGFKDIEVVTDNTGRPRLVLHGEALARHRQENLGEIAVSLAHSKNQAIASVIARKGW
ncbi:MAG: holo-ACP synthase [Syntrophomonadaceae bacterium]|jgi:holo-[acyl-carrier protein] synthase